MKFAKTLWLLLSITACALWPFASSWADSFPSRYDEQIKAAAATYMPGVDWRLLKAQYYQESRLDPSAESPVGAKGIAQFMPGTWRDVSRAIGYGWADPSMAGPAILAGAYYMGRLRRTWHAPRPDADRHKLALASYNAGTGSLLKAQRLAGGANLYAPIAAELPKVTGKYSSQTLTYVTRIWRYWTMMEAGL